LNIDRFKSETLQKDEADSSRLTSRKIAENLRRFKCLQWARFWRCDTA